MRAPFVLTLLLTAALALPVMAATTDPTDPAHPAFANLPAPSSTSGSAMGAAVATAVRGKGCNPRVWAKMVADAKEARKKETKTKTKYVDLTNLKKGCADAVNRSTNAQRQRLVQKAKDAQSSFMASVASLFGVQANLVQDVAGTVGFDPAGMAIKEFDDALNVCDFADDVQANIDTAMDGAFGDQAFQTQAIASGQINAAIEKVDDKPLPPSTTQSSGGGQGTSSNVSSGNLVPKAAQAKPTAPAAQPVAPPAVNNKAPAKAPTPNIYQ